MMFPAKETPATELYKGILSTVRLVYSQLGLQG